MIDTINSFTFLLVSVNIVMSIALIRMVVRIGQFTQYVASFLAEIRSVEVGLARKAREDSSNAANERATTH